MVHLCVCLKRTGIRRTMRAVHCVVVASATKDSSPTASDANTVSERISDCTWSVYGWTGRVVFVAGSGCVKVTAAPCPLCWSWILCPRVGHLKFPSRAIGKVDKFCCLANIAIVQFYRIVSLYQVLYHSSQVLSESKLKLANNELHLTYWCMPRLLIYCLSPKLTINSIIIMDILWQRPTITNTLFF